MKRIKGVALVATLAVGASMLGTAAPAQTNEAARLNAIAACGTISKKSARLACYDAQSAGAPTAAPSAPAPGEPAAQAAATPATPAAAQFTFGKSPTRPARVARRTDVREVTAQATSAVDDGIGHYTITLDSGARWKMTERAEGFTPPSPGDTVRIRKAALGSYLMDVNKQQAVRVSLVE